MIWQIDFEKHTSKRKRTCMGCGEDICMGDEVALIVSGYYYGSYSYDRYHKRCFIQAILKRFGWDKNDAIMEGIMVEAI